MILFCGERKQDILIGMRHVGGSTITREVLFIEVRGVHKGICFIIVHCLFIWFSMFYFIAKRFFWNKGIIYKTLGIVLSVETALHTRELLLPLLCEPSLSQPLSTHVHHHLPARWSAKLMVTALDPESLPDSTWGLLAWWKRQKTPSWASVLGADGNHMGSWGGISWGAFSGGRRETMPILNRKKLS